MHRIALWTLAVATLAIGLMTTPAAAQTAPGAFSPEQSRAIEQMIRDYLLKNPEVILEAIQGLKEREERANAEGARKAIVDRRAELINDASAPIAGNPNGDVTIVEFFDYRCPYCKQVKEPIATLLREDPKVKVVYKEFPILGPDSRVAARAALAAHRQGKYHAVHDGLMRTRGSLDEAVIMKVAADAGVDVARLKRDMEAPEIAESLDRNAQLARALNVSGTPAFIIGNQLVPGAVDIATLKKLVAEARAK